MLGQVNNDKNRQMRQNSSIEHAYENKLESMVQVQESKMYSTDQNLHSQSDIRSAEGRTQPDYLFLFFGGRAELAAVERVRPAVPPPFLDFWFFAAFGAGAGSDEAQEVRADAM